MPELRINPKNEHEVRRAFQQLFVALGTSGDVVLKALFDANTILKADTDNSPEALTIAEQQIVGRITSGSITGLTAAQIRTLINVEDGSTADQSAAEILTALLTVDGAGSGLDADKLDGYHVASLILKSLLTTKGDTVVATGVNTPARLGVGSDGQVMTADSTEASGVKWATPSAGSGDATAAMAFAYAF